MLRNESWKCLVNGRRRDKLGPYEILAQIDETLRSLSNASWEPLLGRDGNALE
jgi:hypothetical protein